jgi:hypothetical protein
MGVITLLYAKEREENVKSILERYHNNELGIDDTVTRLNPYKFLPEFLAARLDREMIQFSRSTLGKLGKDCKNSAQNVDLNEIEKTVNFLLSWNSKNVVKAIEKDLVEFSNSLLKGIEKMSDVYVSTHDGKFFNYILQENVSRTKRFISIINTMPAEVKNTIMPECDSICKSIALSKSGTYELFLLSDLFDQGPTLKNRDKILKEAKSIMRK